MIIPIWVTTPFSSFIFFLSLLSILCSLQYYDKAILYPAYRLEYISYRFLSPSSSGSLSNIIKRHHVFQGSFPDTQPLSNWFFPQKLVTVSYFYQSTYHTVLLFSVSTLIITIKVKTVRQLYFYHFTPFHFFAQHSLLNIVLNY